MRTAEYVLVVIVGLVLVYLFVLTPLKDVANSLNNSAILIQQAQR